MVGGVGGVPKCTKCGALTCKFERSQVNKSASSMPKLAFVLFFEKNVPVKEGHVNGVPDLEIETLTTTLQKMYFF